MSKYQKISTRSKAIFEEKRTFTRIDFAMSIIAVVVLFVIGVRHIDTYGRINILEGLFALSGIFLIDFIRTNDFVLPYQNYKPFKPVPVLLHTTIMLFSVVFIQFVVLRVPFVIDKVELALSIVFASVGEELFFRGVLISGFKKIGNFLQTPFQIKILNFRLRFSILGIIGIIVSSVFFAVIHTNYYDDPRMLLGVLIGGFAFGIGYFVWDDLTANILAHFILNLIAVGQWLVFL